MNPLDYPCPKCKAPAGSRCRALTSGRSTDTHEARWKVKAAPTLPPAPAPNHVLIADGHGNATEDGRTWSPLEPKRQSFWSKLFGRR